MALSSSAPYPFTFSHPAPWVKTSGDGSSKTLCYDCSKLDLEQSFIDAFDFYGRVQRGEIHRPHGSYRKDDGPVYLRDYYYVTSLGDRLSHVSTCRLCNFFTSTVVEPKNGKYKILAFCSSESYLFEPRKKNVRGHPVRRPWEKGRSKTAEEQGLAPSFGYNVFMALVPETDNVPKTGVPVRWFERDLPKNGSIYRLTFIEQGISRLVLPRVVKPEANFGLIRAWLDRCRCHHTKCVRRKPGLSSLPGFRVIDCYRTPLEVVEKPWSVKYVALSYVWGPPSGQWPPTVLDAVEVTKRLGERYLWIDRHCIDQSNLERKIFMISNMDAIYEGAEFTIVCAAGDARTGLPGVKDTPRKVQPSVTLKKRSNRARGKSAVQHAPDSIDQIIGISEEEYIESTVGHTEWLDDLRFGLRASMALDFGELLVDDKLCKKYEIAPTHLDWYREMAEEDGYEHIEDYLQI